VWGGRVDTSVFREVILTRLLPEDFSLDPICRVERAFCTERTVNEEGE
jgi:hypothetical protein